RLSAARASADDECACRVLSRLNAGSLRDLSTGIRVFQSAPVSAVLPRHSGGSAPGCAHAQAYGSAAGGHLRHEPRAHAERHLYVDQVADRVLRDPGPLPVSFGLEKTRFRTD